MTNMYSDFEVDQTLAEEGILVDYEDSNFRVRIANFGESNKKSQVALVRERKALGFRDGANLGEDKADKLIMKVMANYLIKNWEIKEKGKWVQGIHDKSGNKIPFTKENVYQTLKALPVIKNELFKEANNYNLFLKEFKDIDAKN